MRRAYPSWRAPESALRLVTAMALSLGSCGPSAPPPPASGPLPPGVVARVGTREISADEVARIAVAQKISVKEARDIAVRDALLAEGARARGLGASSEAHRAVQADLARRELRHVLAEARSKPFTEEELRTAAERRWFDVDRPEGFRTVHAAVLWDAKKDGDAAKARALSLIGAVRAAVEPLTAKAATMPAPEGPPTGPRIGPNDDPDPLSAAFRLTVLAEASRAGTQVVCEPLPPVSADGRVLVPGNEWFDRDFAKAAAALGQRGALSPVITSQYGFHVIMLLERTAPVVLTGEARVKRLGEDIVNERARAQEKQLLAGLRPQRAVAPDAAALLALVKAWGEAADGAAP